MTGRSLTTLESPIDCLTSKIVEYTKSQIPLCEHIYQSVYNMAFEEDSEFCKAALNENKQDTEFHKNFE